MIREKQIKIIKTRTKVDIKIKSNQILKGEIEKKYNNQKFYDQIWYIKQINDISKFFFYKVFSVDQHF